MSEPVAPLGVRSGRSLRAAVVGCGDVSAVHLDALAGMPDVELTAVVDIGRDRARAAADAWPHGRPAVVTELGELLDESNHELRPDIVHIATPHAEHVPLALDVLAAGVDVLLEKPLASTLVDGERLAAAAAASTARLGVCFQNRYNATSRAMRDVLDAGDLGEVIGAAATVCWHRDAASLNHPVTLRIQGTRGQMVLDGDLTVLPDDGEPVTITETPPGDVGRSYWGASHAALIRDFYAGHGCGQPFWIDAAEALKPLRAIKAVYAQTWVPDDSI